LRVFYYPFPGILKYDKSLKITTVYSKNDVRNDVRFSA